MRANKNSSFSVKKNIIARLIGELMQTKNAALFPLGILTGASVYAHEAPSEANGSPIKKEISTLQVRSPEVNANLLEVSQGAGAVSSPSNGSQRQTATTKLPDLTEPKPSNDGFDYNPNPNGLAISGVIGNTNFKTGVGYSGFMGATANLGISTMLTDSSAIYVELRGGTKETEIFSRFATKVPGTEKDLFALTLADLRQLREFNFGDGNEKQRVKRALAGATYRTQGGEFIQYLDISAYFANTPSYTLGIREVIFDNSTTYQQLTETKRLAGGSVAGISITPSINVGENFNFQATIGAERIKIDYANTNHPAAIDAVKNTLAYNLKSTYKFDKNNDMSVSFGETGNIHRASIGARVNNIVLVEAYKSRSTTGGQGDHGARVMVNIPLDKDISGRSNISLSGTRSTSKNYTPVSNQIIAFAEQRVEFAMANIINVRIDPTVAKVLNINIDKTGIPKNAVIDKHTGDITLTLDAATLAEFGALVDVVNQNTGTIVPVGAITLNGGAIIVRTDLLKPVLTGSSASNPHTLIVRFKNGQSILIEAFDGSVHITKISYENPTVLTAPMISDIGVTGFSVMGGIVDKDGVSGVRYFVYATNPVVDANAKILATVNALDMGATAISVGLVDAASVFVRASGLVKQASKMVLVDSPVAEVKLLKPITPAAPSCFGDDSGNTINCVSGTDLSKLESSVDGGKTYAQFSKDLKFPGAQTVLIREKAVGINLAGKSAEIRFTVDPVKPSTPICTVDDVNNVFTCDVGIDATTLEVSIDGGKTYTSYNVGAKYLGAKTVLVRTKAFGINPPSDPSIFHFTNSAPVINENTVSVEMITGKSQFIDTPKVSDADGDSLVFSLSDAPAGVSISANGVILLPNTLIPGIYNFKRLVTDGVNNPVVQNISVTVKNSDSQTIKDAPTIANVTASSFDVFNNIRDEDGISDVSFKLYAADGVTLSNNVTGTSTGKYTGLTAGHYLVKSFVNVVNGTTGIARTVASEAAAVDIMNVAPVISGTISAQTFTVGTPVNLTLPIATDGNGDAVTYSIVQALPAGLTFNTGTRTISGTPTTAAVAATFTYKAADPSNAFDTKAFSVAVNAAIDTTPDAFDIPDSTGIAKNTLVTTSAVTVAGINTSVTASTTIGTIAKNGTDTGSASVSVVAGDTVAVVLTTPATGGTSVNGSVTIGTRSDSFSLTTINTQPNITGNGWVMDAGTTSPTRNLRITDPDPGYADVTLVSNTGPCTINFTTSTHVVTPASNVNVGYTITCPANATPGDYQATFRVTDNLGSTRDNIVTYTINVPNNPPTISGPADYSVSLGGQPSVTSGDKTLTLADPDGGTLTLSYVSDDPHTTVVFPNGNSITPGAGVSGNLVFRTVSTATGLPSITITVTDPQGNTAQYFVNVTVNP